MFKCQKIFTPILFSLVLLLGVHTGLKAHPHIFIKPTAKCKLVNQQLKGIIISWQFDKWWSEDVLNNCDHNKDGQIKGQEVKTVFKDYFSGVKDYNYFTEITIAKKKINIKKVENFDVKVDQKRLVTYYFTVPINGTYQPGSPIKIALNDKTIYIAFDQKIALLKDKKVTYQKIKYSRYSHYGVMVSFNLAAPKNP